jgi:hypothetical protein
MTQLNTGATRSRGREDVRCGAMAISDIEFRRIPGREDVRCYKELDLLGEMMRDVAFSLWELAQIVKP